MLRRPIPFPRCIGCTYCNKLVGQVFFLSVKRKLFVED
jgi:hypothetical protein